MISTIMATSFDALVICSGINSLGVLKAAGTSWIRIHRASLKPSSFLSQLLIYYCNVWRWVMSEIYWSYVTSTSILSYNVVNPLLLLFFSADQPAPSILLYIRTFAQWLYFQVQFGDVCIKYTCLAWFYSPCSKSQLLSDRCIAGLGDDHEWSFQIERHMYVQLQRFSRRLDWIV